MGAKANLSRRLLWGLAALGAEPRVKPVLKAARDLCSLRPVSKRGL